MNDERESDDITQLIGSAAQNDPQAKEQLYRLVYDDLRRIAHWAMQGRFGSELQTTALVNEVLLRFEKGQSLKSMANRRVFFAVATRAMKQILVDHHRRQQKLVDGQPRERGALVNLVAHIERENGCDVQSLHDALRELEQQSARQHMVVTYRYFGGLTMNQIAELLGVSLKTVERDWRLARAKLYRLLRE